jgi:integrase/recombinase XerD
VIETWFKRPHTLRYLRGGATGPHIDAFADALAEQGYTLYWIRGLVRGVAHLGHWLEKRGTELAALDEGILRAFRAHLGRCRCVRRNEGVLSYCRSSPNRFLPWARRQGAVRTRKPVVLIPPLIREFEAWMVRHRNVASSTLVQCYRPELRRVLDELGDDPTRYKAAPIRSFILARSQRTGRSQAKAAVTAIRLLLRYLVVLGRCSANLVDAVPTLAHWKLAPLPRHLPGEVVDRLLASCDLTTAVGRRDHAMLLLMARLGLRAGDVVALRLNDVDWSGATITVFGKSRREERLPLPQAVGDAIRAWIVDGRRKSDHEQVLLRVRGPHGPLSRITAGGVVQSAARRVGLPPSGSHVLRHSAATALIRAGASLASIGALLRHKHVATSPGTPPSKPQRGKRVGVRGSTRERETSMALNFAGLSPSPAFAGEGRTSRSLDRSR